jgi:phosphohistidine phosphatase
MGRRLGQLVDGIDLALVSPSARTQQTWQLLADGLGPVAEVRTDGRIYQAWGEDLVEIVRTVPDTADTVLLLGHEPGVSELVLLLADWEAPHLRQRVAAKFPTCAAAVLEHSVPWAEIPLRTANLVAFITPKDAHA